MLFYHNSIHFQTFTVMLIHYSILQSLHRRIIGVTNQSYAGVTIKMKPFVIYQFDFGKVKMDRYDSIN